MLGIDFWVQVGLLAFALAVTLLADWLVARLHNEALWPDRRFLPLLDDWLGRLVWVVLMFAWAAIAVRYLERVANPLAGYVLAALAAFLLSLVRAILYRRTVRPAGQGARFQVTGRRPEWRDLLHGAIYVLAALVLLLLLVWIAGQRLQWLALLIIVLGALLPDLDNRASLLGRALPFLSRPLQDALGTRQAWHTPAVAAGLAVLGLPLLAAGGWQAWIALPLGFLAHLLVDLFSPRGVMLLWPLSRTRHTLLRGTLAEPGGRVERWLGAVLGLVTLLLALVVGVGAEPPPPIVVPSFEQTLERYVALRGRSQVFARVQGTWQASGRRMSGTFEVLNAVGSSFVLLDRYTGQVFTAGRAADDNLYLNGISLQTGEEVRIKPAEIRLAGEPLANALPVLYQMQAEPGVQHIYVSGELVLAAGSSALPVDLDQTSLRRVRKLDEGHYGLRYLTAAEFIAMAGAIHVESADLLVVGTYTVTASGPTATPLPLPPDGGEVAP